MRMECQSTLTNTSIAAKVISKTISNQMRIIVVSQVNAIRMADKQLVSDNYQLKHYHSFLASS